MKRTLVALGIVALMACSGPEGMDDMSGPRQRAPENLLDQPTGPAKIGNFIGGPGAELAPNPQGGPGLWKKALSFGGPDKKAQWVTFSVYYPPLRSQPSGEYQYRGPLVGLVEYGVGGAKSAVEFDVQVNKRNVWPLLNPPDPQFPETNGAVFQRAGLTEFAVFGSYFDLSFRNDEANFTVFQSGGPPASGAVIGFSSPGTDFPIVFAFASYGARPRACSQLYRSFIITTPPQPMVAGDVARLQIPGAAKRLRIYRYPLNTTSLEVTFSRGTFNSHGPYAVAAGSFAGTFDLGTQDQEVSIAVAAGSPNVENMVAEYELEL